MSDCCGSTVGFYNSSPPSALCPGDANLASHRSIQCNATLDWLLNVGLSRRSILIFSVYEIRRSTLDRLSRPLGPVRRPFFLAVSRFLNSRASTSRFSSSLCLTLLLHASSASERTAKSARAVTWHLHLICECSLVREVTHPYSCSPRLWSHTRWGPIFIGIILNVTIYGITIMQTALYFSLFKQ